MCAILACYFKEDWHASVTDFCNEFEYCLMFCGDILSLLCIKSSW